ncbi:ABC transporter permease [Actinomadura rupiterrae]|uniref:ABC transporter permease n=1 Tax=Actinomadura rupiterrae TaxID=559627 RepID=UPI0020A5F37B|nr:ABC transporter permease [Actinomadura rupiterrae]MCP2340988.1 ABC-2 type transport system permease protein [Actinomadura rupiterrae]
MTALAGTGPLTRLALRRDRIMLPVWVYLIVIMAASTVSSTKGLYPDTASRMRLASSTNGTPALVALYGRVYDPTSLGAVSMLKLNVFGAVAAAALSIVLVVRHTRADEESGRLELVGATAVGRRAPLTSALSVMLTTNVLIAVLCALALTTAGLPAAGSAAAGLAWGGVGLACGAITAVVAQLTSHARTATGYSFAVLGAFFLVRAFGDTSGEDGPRWLSWLSPIGWGQQFRPYAGNRWWVLLVMVVFAAVMTVVAYALVSRRDLGAGILPDREGPATASARLTGAIALWWRLQRGSLLGWAVAFAILGAALGGIASNVGSMADSKQAHDLIIKLGGEKGITDAFLATEMVFASIFAAAFGVQAVGLLRAEETGQRTEPVLATAVSRWRWAAGPVLIALLGSVGLLLLAGMVAGAVYAGQSGDSAQFGRLVGASLVQIPAAWVVIGIMVLGYGLVPRFTAAGWAVLVAFLLIGEMGPLLKLPHWVMDVSPFAHTPKLPGTAWSATPLVWTTALAAVLIGAGLWAFRRRDITS